eukprot:gene8190-9033_t
MSTKADHHAPTHIEDQSPEERLEVINGQLFHRCSLRETIQLSQRWRAMIKEEIDHDSMVYSEVYLPSFARLILSLRDYGISFDDKAVFIDVGSGIGKLVIAASIFNMFSKCVGIEIVGSLHRKALEFQTVFGKNFRSPLDRCETAFLNGDGTYLDWSYASLIFIHATNFGFDMMKRITNISQRMPVESVLMLVNNRLLDEKCFELARIVTIETTYGSGQVFIYRKMLRGGLPKDLARARLEAVLKKTYDL